MNGKRIVILAPHTDDGEFGAGGAICRWIEEGADVYYFAFSACHKSIPQGYPQDALVKELFDATNILKLPHKNVRILDFEVRRFLRDRQEILDEMIVIRNEIKPDLVILPHEEDLHQDHSTIAKEGLRAFKYTSIMAYEVPWNNFQFQTRCFVKLSERHVERKLMAIECYKSQSGRIYTEKEFLLSQMKFRGVQSGGLYAETFDIIRWFL